MMGILCRKYKKISLTSTLSLFSELNFCNDNNVAGAAVLRSMSGKTLLGTLGAKDFARL